MTKFREPGSLKDALFVALGLLGDEVAAEACGLSSVYLRACSDPDGEKRLPAEAMLAIEVALARHGHPPLFTGVIRRALIERAAGADALGLTVDPLRRLGEIAAQFGPLASVIADADDDERISPRERREMLRRAVDLEAAVHSLIVGLNGPPAPAGRARGRRG